MFCGRCGKQLDDGSRFCSACGTPVGAAPMPAEARPTNYSEGQPGPLARAKIRVKCPKCGHVSNVSSVNDPCPECRQPLDLPADGSIYIYRQGSPYGIAGKFGIYINGEPFGYIGNRELLRLPVRFGTYNIHSAVGISRRCEDMQVTVTPANPTAYAKIYILPGAFTNKFKVVPLDPSLLK